MKRYIHILCKLRTFLTWGLLFFILSCSGNLSQTVIFEDQFERLPVGFISFPESSDIDYHYFAGAGKIGPWEVTSYGRDPVFKKAWEIVNNNSRIFLQHNYHAIDKNLERKNSHFHSMIVGGDSTWHDYKVTFEFSPKALNDQCGLVFRYVNDQCYYFFGMEGNMLVIKMVQYATGPKRPYERILASQKFKWNVNKVYRGEVSIRENKIYALLNDTTILISEDNSYSRGKVGLLSDVPAAFYSVQVTTLKREKRKISRYESQLARQKAMRVNENTNAVLWKKFSTKGIIAGNCMRFGDLNSDGEIDVLIGQVSLKHKGLVCLTAMTFDGQLLWQKGNCSTDDYESANDAAFQIHDIDGDGDKEVVFLMDNFLQIAEGKTGKLIRRFPAPSGEKLNATPVSALGDCIYFCDLSGKARDSDIIFKDRNQYIWAYNEHFKLLWSSKSEKGHYPHALDIDHDGHDEIAVGYSMLDHDGTVIWNKDKEIGDHSDGVLIASKLDFPGSSFNVIYGAGDWGTIIVDSSGNVVSHNPVGYVQNQSIANFRPDLPGLEMISVNFWGSQGIIHFYDASGNIYHSIEPGPYGSMCLPINWRGDESSFFVLNTNPGDGGIFDGKGNFVVAFPDDGHPELYNAVLDITGDARDEVVTWDQDEIWVYTQQDNPRRGNIHNSEKNPIFNFSKYQVSYAYPEEED